MTREWTVYLIRCRAGELYCGITKDLARRIQRHNAGKASRYSRTRLPVSLVWHEDGHTLSTALRREAAIKRLSRKQKEELVRCP